MRRMFVSMVVLVGTLLCSGNSAWAQEPVSPGKEHAELKKMEGVWDAVVRTPDGSESKGVSEYKMKCGDLWLVSSFEGNIGGQKFSGQGFDGYDPEKKHYTSVWVDSMSATPLMLTGTKDATGKILTMTGEGPGPDGPMKYKMVTTTESADKHTFQMFLAMPQGETEMMTIAYTRRKK